LLAHVDAADEVVGDADVGQPRHEVFAEPVVQHALALDRRLLLGVEGGGVILEILDEGPGLRALVEDLRLAFVDLLATWCHGSSVPGARTAGGPRASQAPYRAWDPLPQAIAPRRPREGLRSPGAAGIWNGREPFQTGARDDHLRRPRTRLRGEIRP